MKEKIINDIYYKEFNGINETILILHGWGGTSKSWIKMGELLNSKGFNVIIPDLPGFGASEINEVLNLEKYADKLIAFIKKLNLNNYILWGHSNGGAISIKIANTGKTNIKKLILNNSAGIRNDKKRSFKRKSISLISKPFKIFKNFKWFQKVRELFYRLIKSKDYIQSEKKPFLKETYLNIIGEDLREDLKKINIDTLLIWGEKDTYTPLTDGKIFNKSIIDSKLVVLDNEKHGIHLQNPNRLLNTFLENI